MLLGEYKRHVHRPVINSSVYDPALFEFHYCIVVRTIGKVGIHTEGSPPPPLCENIFLEINTLKVPPPSFFKHRL